MPVDLWENVLPLPKAGDILGSNGLFTIKYEKGKEPFIYGIAEVVTLGTESKWQLVSKMQNTGIKIILYPRARDKVIKKFGLTEHVTIKSVKIIKASESNKALIAEVHEW